MKKITKHIQYLNHWLLCLLLLAFITHKAAGQKETPLNAKLQNIAKPESVKGWIYFRDSFKANPITIFTDLKDAFELSDNDQMVLKKTEKDGTGFTHYRYQQYYKNYRVLYGEYLVHQQSDGFLNAANGRLITGLQLNNTISVTEKPALTAALNFMGAAKYLWQNIAMEKELKRQQKNENATYFPKGELVYAPDEGNDSFNASGYHLAWCFKIYPDNDKVMPKAVYVDVLTGKVIYHTQIAMNCSGGSGTSAYNGTVSLNTSLIFKYYAHNDCQATNIYVYDCNRGSTSTTLYSDADNSWNAVSQQSAVQAQWGAAQTYSYYNVVHNRQSYDGQSQNMTVYNNAVYGNPATANNACWNCIAASAIFGAGNTTDANDDWNSDDIMGHEFTHGVTGSSAQLDYNKEPGALNESFSDIFGEMVESGAEGNCDYLVGADRAGGAIRSLKNPKNYTQPDTYLGTNWISPAGCTPSQANDNCYVHTNSGVQNYWFYLLSEGGSGTNDKGEAYSVKGITRFEARQIAYQSLTHYLNSSSQYIDARRASLQAAVDLYGSCSQEAISVGDAWHAVGVESQSPEYAKNVCGTFPASGYFVQAISTLNVANGCSTVITPTSNYVYFAARDKIIFSPGFIAQSGSSLVAYINPCSSTDYRIAAPPMSDAERGITITANQKNTSTEAKVLTDDVAVSPNPFNTTFIVSINSKQNAKANIIIYNAVGVKVKEQNGVNLIKGVNKITINGANLPQGVYMLEINFGNLKTVEKIVKM